MIEALESPSFPRPFALVTATPELDPRARRPTPARSSRCRTSARSRIRRRSAARYSPASRSGLDSPTTVPSPRSSSRRPTLCGSAIADTTAWAEDAFTGVATPTAAIAFGTGPGWAAALESALLVKEVARIPCEGVETREGATAAMTGLLPEHLALSLPSLDDRADRRGGADLPDARGDRSARPRRTSADRRLSAITDLPGRRRALDRACAARRLEPGQPGVDRHLLPDRERRKASGSGSIVG